MECEGGEFDWDGYESQFGFNYLRMYECASGAAVKVLVCGLMVVLVPVAFYLLGTTADNYFSPTLGTICERLRLSPELAGVTFLAFGNGAPDVFSTLASFTNKSASTELGLSALLGAAMFLTTVVFGSVCHVAKDLAVNPSTFVRDCGFFIFTVGFTFACGISGDEVTTPVAMFFLFIYFVYVSTVFAYDWWTKRSQKDRSKSSQGTQMTEGFTQSSFWHMNDATSEQEQQEEEGDSSNGDNYEFVTFADGNGQEETSAASLEMTITNGGPPEIIDDYIPMPTGQQGAESFASTQDGVESLSISLRRGRRGNGNNNVLAAFYWRQLRWRQTAHRQAKDVAEEWQNMSWKERALWGFEQPFLLIRKLTIPSIDEDRWQKSLVVMQPVICTCFLLFVSGYLFVWKPGFVVLAILIAAAVSVMLQFVLHASQPPTNAAMNGFLLCLAFLCCIGWIFFVANELVALLTTLGYVVGANPSILGLTVLAMGNSMGDLVANTAISRSGMTKMAIAGCFGSPLLNILIGLGLSLTVLSLEKEGGAVHLKLDVNCIISALFVMGTLALICLSTWRNKFVIPRHLPKVLVGVYFAYVTVSIASIFVTK